MNETFLASIFPELKGMTDHEVSEKLSQPTPRKYREYNRMGAWWTVEQAAEAFNVTVREIEERYRPLMPAGTVTRKMRERVYRYDFEAEDCELEDYRPVESWGTDPRNLKSDCFPELESGFIPDEDDDGDFLRLISVEEKGDDYDPGLEPVSRRQVDYLEQMYLRDALLDLREEKLQSRREKPLPARGKGGKFTKKTA